MPKLSDTRIRTAKPRAKPFKLYDENGLFIIVRPDGARWGRIRYCLHGKEQTLSLGVYPDVSLASMRERAASIRKQIASHINPGTVRRQQKLAQATAAERAFKEIAAAWLAHTAKALKWTEDHQERVRRRRELWLDPWIGRSDVGEITEDQVANCLHRIVEKGLYDTARRARAEAHQVFRFARARRLVQQNPVTELLGPGLLPNMKVKHHASIKDPQKLGALLRAIDVYPGGIIVQSALKLLALTFVRPGELRFATWAEFDLDGSTWRIPGERMKMREAHLVPLADQAVQVLRELELISGPDGFVLPQARNFSRPISENTLSVALRVMGYAHGQMTAHGFRSTASTLLNELGYNRDHIERQLSHGPRDKVRAAYNSAEYLPDRRRMMQAWANYLDSLRVGSNNVTPIRRSSAA
jgi:integrase